MTSVWKPRFSHICVTCAVTSCDQTPAPIAASAARVAPPVLYQQSNLLLFARVTPPITSVLLVRLMVDGQAELQLRVLLGCQHASIGARVHVLSGGMGTSSGWRSPRCERESPFQPVRLNDAVSSVHDDAPHRQRRSALASSLS